MKFRCDCEGHILEINSFSVSTIKGLAFEIYDIYSPKGRKYKKPKRTADVVVMNNKYSTELDKLMKYILKYKAKPIRPKGLVYGKNSKKRR